MRKTTVLLLLLLLATLGLGWDLQRPPSRQLSTAALVAGIGLYRTFLSSALARGGIECRFFPSCSRYAEASIREHGALVGSLRAIRRLARCGPWTARMTVDPP